MQKRIKYNTGVYTKIHVYMDNTSIQKIHGHIDRGVYGVEGRFFFGINSVRKEEEEE